MYLHAEHACARTTFVLPSFKPLLIRTLILTVRIWYLHVAGIFALTLEIRDLIVDAPLSCYLFGLWLLLPMGVDSYLFAHVISRGLRIKRVLFIYY